MNQHLFNLRLTLRQLDLIIFALRERADAIARIGGKGHEGLREEYLNLCQDLESIPDPAVFEEMLPALAQ